MPAVRDFSAGEYWCGAVLGNYIFLSAHILDHLEEGGRADKVITETSIYVHDMKAKYCDLEFEVIMGVDANIGLPPFFDRISGGAVLPLRRSHTPAKVRIVASWFEGLGLTALNTYGSMTDGEQMEQEDLWTRMASRRASSQSQIDYLMVSTGIYGRARPCSIHRRSFQRSDHRPIIGDLRLPIGICEPVGSNRSLKGWRPANEEAREVFKRHCVELCGQDLAAMQVGIKMSALQVQHDTIGERKRKEQTAQNAARNEARKRVTRASGVNYRAAVVEYRRATRKAQIKKNEEKLRLVTLSSRPTRMPMLLTVDGQATSDRQIWMDGAVRFGRERFGDETNTFEVQRDRLVRLGGAGQGYRLDGIQPPSISPFAVVNARAHMKSATAAGSEGTPPEVYKELPYAVLINFWKHFEDRLQNNESADPESWKVIEFIGLPKDQRRTEFESFRWIGKLDCCFKWYMRSLLPQLQASLRSSAV